jgi:predicted dehydrogenase
MRVSVIGVGSMGRRHISVLLKLGLDLVGIVDVSQQSLEEAKRHFSLNKELLFDDINRLMAKVIPDCLIIATTANSHCDLACQAAKLGVKYILVEKPMAVSLEECERMLSTCEKYGAQISVNHQMRFLDQYSMPKALLNSDAYGGFQSMTVVGGNFGMSMNGTHYLEAFRYISEEDPFEVTAWFDTGAVSNPRGDQFKDVAGSIRVTTSSGKRLYMEIGSGQGHGLEVLYAARNGLISVSELNGKMTATVRSPEFKELPTTRYGMPAESTSLLIAPVEVIDSTAKVLNALFKDDCRVTGEQGMMAIKVLVAAYVSAENGNRPVQLDHQLDRFRVFPWA